MKPLKRKFRIELYVFLIIGLTMTFSCRKEIDVQSQEGETGTNQRIETSKVKKSNPLSLKQIKKIKESTGRSTESDISDDQQLYYLRIHPDSVTSEFHLQREIEDGYS